MRTFAPGPLRGEITVPGDKSISHRALLLGALSPRPLKISNLNPGRDVYATAQALDAIGAGSGALHDPSGTIDCLNSGSTARMMMGVITGANLNATFDGDESLRKRPMEPVAAHLRAFGAKIETTDGKMPVHVRGTATPESRRIILVSPSAQIKTSLLLAAAYSGTPIEILGDKASRDHTERLLHYFGADIAYDRSKVTLRSMPSSFKDVTVAGDFSAAAFFMVAATVAPGSEIVIKDCGVNPSRTGLLDAMRMMGASITIENQRTVSGEPVGDIRVKSAALRGAEIGADLALRAIDEIVVLAVAAAFASGRTRITGVRELRTKESDRIAAIERLLSAAGIGVEVLPNGIAIDGGTPRADGEPIETHGDHRTAMAAAALAAGAGTLAIDDEACIAVSFPAFIEQLERVQA